MQNRCFLMFIGISIQGFKTFCTGPCTSTHYSIACCGGWRTLDLPVIGVAHPFHVLGEKDGFRNRQPYEPKATGPTAGGQRQSRISGKSSPFSATYSLCRWIASEYYCSAASACAASRGTRRTASSDNWKRSMLLSTHISKGVVVVPSSL